MTVRNGAIAICMPLQGSKQVKERCSELNSHKHHEESKCWRPDTKLGLQARQHFLMNQSKRNEGPLLGGKYYLKIWYGNDFLSVLKKKQDRIVVRLALKYPCWTVRWVLFACVFLFSLEKKKTKTLKKYCSLLYKKIECMKRGSQRTEKISM